VSPGFTSLKKGWSVLVCVLETGLRGVIHGFTERDYNGVDTVPTKQHTGCSALVDVLEHIHYRVNPLPHGPISAVRSLFGDADILHTTHFTAFLLMKSARSFVLVLF